MCTVQCNKEKRVYATRHKFRCSRPYIFATQCRRPLIFQFMNSVRANSLSLKCQSFTPSGYKDIGIRTFEFVAKSEFLYAYFVVCNLYIQCKGLVAASPTAAPRTASTALSSYTHIYNI